MYRTNDVIVLAVEHSDFISVGLIAAILYKEDSCYFVVNKYNALRDGNFGYFETIGFVLNLAVFSWTLFLVLISIQ